MPLPRQCFSRWTIISVVAIFIIVTVTVTCATYFTLAKKKHHAFDWTKVTSSRGDVIPDFSFAGYQNSAIILPYITAPNITVLFSNSVDVRPAIQAAIDSISSSGGGSVILPAGKWSMTAGLNLSSNVVVTGSVGGKTVLSLSEKPSVPVFTLGSSNTVKPKYGFRSNITNDYVPVGSSSVEVVDSSGFAVDQLVYVARIATESWIAANGMHSLVRNDASQTWIPENKRFMTPNQISGVDGNNITLKIPLTDNINLDYLQPELIVYSPPETSNEMGIRDLSIEVPETCSGASLSDKTCNFAAVRFPSWTVDSWASGLTLKGFNKFFQIDQDASRITIQNTTMNRDKDISGSTLPFDIMIQGSQVLVQDCEQVGISSARCFSVATGSLTPGPNAVLRHKTQSNSQTIYPHQRWAQGLLVEDTSVATYFVNRNLKGSGQGWSINGGVGWNIDGYCEFESPPTGINWCIGCGEKGNEPKGNATLLETGQRVEPRSLFQAQLQKRGVHRDDGEES